MSSQEHFVSQSALSALSLIIIWGSSGRASPDRLFLIFFCVTRHNGDAVGIRGCRCSVDDSLDSDIMSREYASLAWGIKKIEPMIFGQSFH
jgi:hypothetical protein